MYGEKEYLADLRRLGEDVAWNDIVEKAKEANLCLDDFTKEGRAKAAKLINEYRGSVCPQEYKDNPNIHYEVARRKEIVG